MEFSTIKPCGYVLHVVFNGGKYIFFNDYCGIAAIAERQQPIADKWEHFVIKYGNDHLVGGSLGGKSIGTAVRRHITKAERKYVKKVVKFTYEYQPLETFYATIEVKQYNTN